MNRIPLLQTEDDEIRQSLSLEEIRIALNSLRKRFKEYTPQEIVQALFDYLYQKDFKAQSVPIGRGPMTRYPVQYPRLPEPNFMHHLHKPITPEQRQHKTQQIRLVARLFIQTGINYSLAQYFYPEMTKKQYKLDLQTITVQTLHNIQKFLRYQQQVQVDCLNKDEKHSIRQRMLNIRDWMAKTHSEQMKTYFMFIERSYLNENVEIDFKMAIDLHKVILETARGPFIERQQKQNVNNRGLGQLFPLNQEQKKGITKQQKNSLILLFKQHCSIQRVSDLMCQKYGYHIRWSVHSVKNILIKVYKISLQRLAISNKRILGQKTTLWFGYGDEDVKLLMQYENSLEIKLLLLDFYLLAKISKLKLMEYVRKVNAFFVKQHQGDTGFEDILSEEDQIRIPTLIIEDRPIPTILIKDDQQSNDKSKKQPQSKKKKISKPPKDKKGRPLYKEFINIDSDSDEEDKEVYIFSQDKAYFEKSAAQDDTDIEDQEPKNKQEKIIFKPNAIVNFQRKKETKLREFKEKTIQPQKTVEEKPQKSQKTQKPEKTLQQKPQQRAQEEVKTEQIEVVQLQPRQKETQKKVTRNSNLNKSIDSSISEPSQLQNYRAFRQQGKIPQKLNALIRKQLDRKLAGNKQGRN